MKGARGFTLVELLTVIAIIAILAAITFPVIVRTKDSAYKSTDISNMNALRTALTLYREDQGAYPPALLGYATLYSSGPLAGQVIPATALQGFLYPKRIDSISAMRPSYNRSTFTALTQAVYPNQDPRAVGSAPLLDLNGDGNLTSADDPANARQAYGPTDGFVQRGGGVGAAGTALSFYSASGYDVAQILRPAIRVELRYCLFWSVWGLGSGNASDDPRQLGYADPPESTVVTWNSAFRDYDPSGYPLAARRDVVLFLGGQAKTYDSKQVFERSWRVMP